MDETLKIVITALLSGGGFASITAFIGWYLRKKTELGFTKEQADIDARRADDANVTELAKAIGVLAQTVQNPPAIFNEFMITVKSGFESLITLAKEEHEATQKMLTEYPVKTDERVKGVVKVVDRNGDEIRQLITEKTDLLTSKFDELSARIAKLEADVATLLKQSESKTNEGEKPNEVQEIA